MVFMYEIMAFQTYRVVRATPCKWPTSRHHYVALATCIFCSEIFPQSRLDALMAEIVQTVGTAHSDSVVALWAGEFHDICRAKVVEPYIESKSCCFRG